jgi:PAS domain S-box-containing protein
MSTPLILLADSNRSRAAHLTRQLEAIGFTSVLRSKAPEEVRQKLTAVTPDVLIIRREWEHAVPVPIRNGQSQMAILLLGQDTSVTKGAAWNGKEMFRELNYPIDDTSLRLTLAGALASVEHSRALAVLESRFACLAGITSDYAYSVVVAADGKITREWATGALERITGYSEREMEKQGSWRNVVYPSDLRVAENQYQALLRGEEAVSEFRVLTRAGAVRWVRSHGRPVKEENTGRVSRITVVVTDITAQRAMEQALRESEERWKFALDASGEAVWDWDVETGSIFHSERWLSLTGADAGSAAGSISESMARIHPDDRKRVAEEIRKYFREEVGQFEAEYRFRSEDGSYRWVLDRGKIVGWAPDGKPRRVIGTISDVTVRKQAEEDLARTNEFLRDILESSSTISIISSDEEDVIRFWNSGAENLLGYRAEEVVGKMRLQDLYPKGDGDAATLALEIRNLVIRQKQTVSRPMRQVRRDGNIVWMKVTVSPRLDRHGVVRGMLGVGEDLTTQRTVQAIKEQRERELRLMAFTLNCALDGFCITDLEYTILYVNDSFRILFGYGEDELLGQNIRVLGGSGVPNRSLREIDEQIRRQGWSGVVQGRRKDCSEFLVEVSISVVLNDQGEPVALVGVARDITERVQAEERIRSSLKEKEVMLKEIHHRVKNNLQVISSLLNLQSAQEQNPAILAALKESQGRVRSMALVHEELYRSNDLADINMDSYVRKLTANLFFAYQSATTRVVLDIDVRDVYLPVDTAIPCGLIINELISNSLKYAFKKRQKGLVTVRFDHDGPAYRLVVSDDGVGLPKDLDIENTESLGLQLVGTLAKQLRGAIEVDRTTGTSFTLEFALQGKQTHA